MNMHYSYLRNTFLDFGLRIIIGSIFLIAGISKLPLQEEWVESVVAYRFLPIHFANLYLSILPWIEVTIGLCLIIGLFTKYICLFSIPVLVSFIGANLLGFSINHSGECQCFGELATISYKVAMVIDALLFVGIALVFFQRRRVMALDSWLTRLVPKLRL